MAFMAMRKNLDERARKKEFDEIFLKFDHNQNGSIKTFARKHFYEKYFRENLRERLCEGNKAARSGME